MTGADRDRDRNGHDEPIDSTQLCLHILLLTFPKATLSLCLLQLQQQDSTKASRAGAGGGGTCTRAGNEEKAAAPKAQAGRGGRRVQQPFSAACTETHMDPS